MRGCLQHDENDCGLACILTICKFLKICVDETALRKNIFLGNDGLSLYGITEVFRTIGMKSLAVEGTNIELYSLLSEEKKPIIIMINEDDEYHYVVLYKTNNNKVFLWDPNKGKRIITKEYFDLIWSSYAIIITEILEIDRVVLPKKSVCWTALFQQKKLLALLVIFSVILMAISVITTFLYKNIIDQIEIGIPTFTPQLKSFFIVMGGCYLLVSILSIVKGKLIAYLKMELEITLQNQFVESLLNISIQKKDDYTSGGVLERNGYEVRVFDVINPETSWCYNPFAYVWDDKDVLKLINNLIRNTTPKGAQSSDPFWEKSETALLQALMLYLLHEAPPEEQNFPMIMEMLGSAQVKEDDEDYQSPLDILFERLEMRDPESIAVKQYAIYKQAAGKTAKSILISVGVRLAAFNLKQIANLTCTDELDLYSIGEKKVALFCCIPDADTSMNYLVGMIYSNLFQTLYYVADRKYGGRLPIPVHCIMDEWPNVALPDDFDKILATMRSRGISCSIIIQNIAQMKALFKDSYESLIGNCDEFLYLGGNEKEGHKYVSELLGKETLDTNTYGQTKGRSGSYSVNYQQTGRELLTPDEIRLLDNRKAILFIRGERPIMDDKYDLKKHVNFRYTEDGGASPYDYAKTPLAHDDLKIDINRLDDYELLSTEDILGE